MDALSKLKGGILFVPAGTYKFNSDINVPIGVTLCGQWANPDTSPAAKGTIFAIYSDKGSSDVSKAFCTLSNSCMVRDITFWYPEQTGDLLATRPVAYPATVLGGSYCQTRNVTFVNSYVAYQQGPNMSGCPSVFNAYGTTLFKGMDIDGIADIGRFDTIHFDAKYWVNSKLAGAPTGTQIDNLKNWLYSSASGIILRRIDWSYVVFSSINGYANGLVMNLSNCTEEFNPNNIPTGQLRNYSYPNGHVYGLDINDCATGLYLFGVSGAGEELASCHFNNCDTGIYIASDPHSVGGVLQVADCAFDCASNSVYQSGFTRLNMVSCTFNSGLFETCNYVTTVTNSTFNGDAPQVMLDIGTTNAIFVGNTFKNPAVIQNDYQCPSVIDNGAVLNIPKISPLTADKTATQKTIPPRVHLTVASNLDATGKQDVTADLQALLNAEAAAGGGIVFLPPGNYKIAGNISLPTSVELLGAVDIGRVPYNTGSILEVTGGKTDVVTAANRDAVTAAAAAAPATITMSASSILRGVVFDYPEQYPYNMQSTTNPGGDTNFSAYPYAIRGNGANIAIVNVSDRNGWSGIDLMTNKCDNHYVDYFAGQIISNAISVGNGSNGIIENYQTNYNAMLGGADSGWGAWPNAPAGGTDRSAFETLMKQQTQNYAANLRLGDCNEIVFDCFSYSGRSGVQFISQNGKGPDGIMVGQGMDFASNSFEIQGIGNMQVINTQLTAFQDATVPVDNKCHIFLESGFTGTFNMFNLTMWAAPDCELRADSGTLNVYNCNFNSGSQMLIQTTTGGNVHVQNGLINQNSVKVSNGNYNRITIDSCIYNTLADMASLIPANFTHSMAQVTRWSPPLNAVFDPGSILMFAESFDNYMVENRNGVVGVPTNSAPFVVAETVSPDRYVNNVFDTDGDQVMKLYSDANAPSSTVTLINKQVSLPSGADGDVYNLEARVNVDTLRGGQSFFGLGLGSGKSGAPNYLVMFNSQGIAAYDASTDTNTTVITSWTPDTWYRVAIKLDGSDINNKTYQVTIYDDDYNVIAQSKVFPLPDIFQGGVLPFGSVSYALIGDPGSAPGTSTAMVDYSFAAQISNSYTLGDVNGDGKINTVDARMVLQYIVNKITASDLNLQAADVDGNGAINTVDARLILQYIVNKINAFPK